MATQVSVVMPAYNEADTLAELVPQTAVVLERLGGPFEIIVVDDGSTDRTRPVMAALSGPNVAYLRLRRNAGKSAALSVGLERAQGEIVVLMDADGQDDPEEIPKLISALGDRALGADDDRSEADGLDLVTGRRVIRHDRLVKRTTSRLYNGATARVTGVPGRDFNSGLKAMRRELAGSIEMYGELHRYIPVLAVWGGFRVGEVDVAHHARRHGDSKFGRARFWRGFLDLITVKFLTTYTARPFHLFGGLGLVMGLAGTALLVWMAVLRISGRTVGDRPALLAGVLLVVVGVQIVSLGLMAELIVHLRRRTTLDAAAEVTEP
ncbi:glycosyltransferase family 2 protein [soil metagenome]